MQENLADRVRTLREELGLSQEALARKMGYQSRTSLNKIEKGRPVSQKIIVRLAEALDTTPSVLMGWVDEEPSKKNSTRADVTLLMLRDREYSEAIERTSTDERFRSLVIKLAHTEDEKLQSIYQLAETLL